MLKTSFISTNSYKCLTWKTTYRNQNIIFGAGNKDTSKTIKNIINLKKKDIHWPSNLCFRFGDNTSVSSGDSILIGVEEQTDFTNYKVTII